MSVRATDCARIASRMSRCVTSITQLRLRRRTPLAALQRFQMRRHPSHTDHNRTVTRCMAIKTSAELDAEFDKLAAPSAFVPEEQEALGPNPGLESVIAQGITALKSLADDIDFTTRVELKKRNHKLEGPTTKQIMEAERVEATLTDCLENLIQQQQEGKVMTPPLHLNDDPIVIAHVEVNKNLRLAKVYWSLPYGVLMDSRVTWNVYQKMVSVIEPRVQQNAKQLQFMVHSKLRAYYPPRLRFTPATSEMVEKLIQELRE